MFTATRRSGLRRGRLRRSTAFTNVKIMQLRPMPSASAVTAAAVNHRSLNSIVAAKRRSCQRDDMNPPLSERLGFDDLSVKELDGAIGGSAVAGIVSDHANGRAASMEL